MSQTKKAVVRICLAVLIMLIISTIAYFLGNLIAERFIFADASKNDPIGVSLMSMILGMDAPTEIVGPLKKKEWRELYLYYEVPTMGLITGAILILWTALTHWGLPMSGSVGAGKRWLWALFGIIVVAACVLHPVYFSLRHPLLLMDKSIQLLFIVCYGIAGYWGGSIVVTSDRYQHTPLFARFFR